MDYFPHMVRILRMDGTVFKTLAPAHLPLRYCMINVTALGLIYGVVSIQFAKLVLARQPEAAATFSPLLILLVGISIAFFMHSGLALFIWVFSRGIGGNRQFMPVYLYSGMAVIGLWPLAPAASALQAGTYGAGLTVYTALATVYGSAVMVVAVKAASGLSWLKVSLAAAATTIYVGCFLYLWI